jgi:hypothetical protein
MKKHNITNGKAGAYELVLFVLSKINKKIAYFYQKINK